MSRNSKKIIPVINNAIAGLEKGHSNASLKSPRLNDSWIIAWLSRVRRDGKSEDCKRAEIAISRLNHLIGKER